MEVTLRLEKQGRSSALPLPVLAWFTFFVFGVALVLPGASQPALAAELGLGLAASGALASCLSLGLGFGVVASGPLVDRLPRRPFFCAAAIVAALSVIGVPALGGVIAVFVALVALGVGAGGFETVMNTIIPERDPERAASRLAVAHSAATAGAALGAMGLAVGIDAVGWRGAWIGVGFAAFAVAIAGATHPMPQPRRARVASVADSALWPGLLPYAIASAAYVGMESALTVFLPPFVAAAGGNAQEGAVSISALWAGLFVSRIGFALWRGAPERRVLGAGTLGAVSLLVIAPVAGSVAAVWAAAVGLLLGPVFPILVARTSTRFSHARGTATGWVVGAGSLGGVVFPWGAGLIGEASDVSWAIVAVGVGSLGILAATRR